MREVQLSSKAQAAAILQARGMSYRAIAEEIHVAPSTIAGWQKRDDYRKLVYENVQTYMADIAPEALDVLKKQLYSKNEWLAQNAARELMRLASQASGQSNASIKVEFGADLPEPGMPETAQE